MVFLQDLTKNDSEGKKRNAISDYKNISLKSLHNNVNVKNFTSLRFENLKNIQHEHGTRYYNNIPVRDSAITLQRQYLYQKMSLKRRNNLKLQKIYLKYIFNTILNMEDETERNEKCHVLSKD